MKTRQNNYEVMYWRPQRISKKWLWFSLAVSIGGMAIVQCFPASVVATDEALLNIAATKADQAMKVIADVQRETGHRTIKKLDPQRSHLVGPSMSMVTSKMGSLESKQTSINPNYAAVVVRWLQEAGVKPGDRVAIGASGSWPALNIAVYAACETMDLQPTILLSAASSQYGANMPEMMWVDMEQHLRSAGVFSYKAKAASLGGLRDRAAGMSKQTRQMLVEAVKRNGISLMHTESVDDSIGQRMAIYESQAASDRYAAYINVGGGSASIGGTEGQKVLSAGVHKGIPLGTTPEDCVAARMLAQGIAVLHVGDATRVARRYDLAIAPATLPAVGESNMFAHHEFRSWLATLVMMMTAAVMTVTVAPQRILQAIAWLRKRKQLGIHGVPAQVKLMI